MSLKNLRDTVSSLKRRSVALKVCPRCGSADVSVLTFTGFMSQPMYVCNNCSFEGYIFLEVTMEKGENPPRETLALEGEEQKEERKEG